MKNYIFISLLILLSHLYQLNAEIDANHSSNISVVKEIQVGVILDMGSLVGKVVNSCISMAISDFYALNTHYTTRILLHIRDSKGEPLRALSAALDLLENMKVQAIIGPGTSPEAMLLAALGDKAKVPILSFSRTPPTEYPYLVQLLQDQTLEFYGVASVVESFQWTNVILIYEEGEIISNLADSFQEKNIRIAYRSAISPSATDEQILVELHNITSSSTPQTTFVVHVSPSLASRLFLNVKRLGMMSEGYAWIVTDKTMDLLHSMDSSVLIESMQGVLGFKSHIPSSYQLSNFTVRWRRKFRMEKPNMEMIELNVFGLWAYDAIWALARAVERVTDKISQTKKQNVALNVMDLANIGASQSGSIILNELLQIRFRGLSGEFQFMNGKLISRAFEIVNVFGKGERRVGFWTLTDGITREMFPTVSEKHPTSSSTSGLEAIIWPGGSSTTPKGWLMPMNSKKLRIGVPVKQGFEDLIKVHHDPGTNATTATGFCIDVFKAAIDALPSDVSYEFIPFEDSNGEPAGNYNDLVYQVYLQNYDGVVGDITITANRSLYVDFTMPFTDLGAGTIARVARVGNKNMWIFLKPLDSNLWLTSAAFFILTGFVVWVIEHSVNEEFQGSAGQQIGTVFWFSFSTLVFAHREKLSSNLSRLIVIVWVFVVLILTSSYTATLSSLLTVQQIQLTSKDNYIGYQRGSLDIVSNLNFQDTRLRPYYSPEEYADALSRGTKNGGVDAIVDEIPYMKAFFARYPHDYAMIASESTTNGFAFVFQKGSPLVSEMSRAIMKLREEGKLVKMEKAWFNSESSSMAQQDSVTSTNNNPNVLNLDNFSGLFLISGICSALALVIFLINLLCENWNVIKYYFFIKVYSKAVERALMLEADNRDKDARREQWKQKRGAGSSSEGSSWKKNNGGSRPARRDTPTVLAQQSGVQISSSQAQAPQGHVFVLAPTDASPGSSVLRGMPSSLRISGKDFKQHLAQRCI
ncbi:glutamate receptor 2.3-like [Cornus florida]|uniref:glutamate receptor 2.3-like n=1 Tax=Cornus florida TaxID=4283 RepID=UPI00289F3BF1|nr:glutamate receptor 2.3-like [Cornus florida]